MKYLGKGATGRIVEESEDRLNQLIQVKIQVRVSKIGPNDLADLTTISGFQRQLAKPIQSVRYGFLSLRGPQCSHCGGQFLPNQPVSG